MFEVKYTTRFKKDYKLLKKRGCDMNKLLDVIDVLREGRELPPQYKDHPLRGDYEGHRDCHIEPDWENLGRDHEKSLFWGLYLPIWGFVSVLDRIHPIGGRISCSRIVI